MFARWDRGEDGVARVRLVLDSAGGVAEAALDVSDDAWR